jgi:hypothetical protein
MFARNLLFKFGPLMIAVAMIVGSPALSYASGPKEKYSEVTGDFAVLGTGNTGPLTMAAPGKASVVMINYFGSGRPLFVTLDGKRYEIPAQMGASANHSQIQLAPGTYAFTASVPDVGTVTRSIDVTAGSVTGLNFYGGSPETPLVSGDDGGNTPGSTIVFKDLLFAQSNLTGEIQ